MPEAFFLWNSFPEACFVKRQSGSSRSLDFGKVVNREVPEARFLGKSSIGKIPKRGFWKSRQSGKSRSLDFGKVANREVPEPALCALNADFVLLSLNISLSMPAEGCFLAIKQNPTFRLCRKCISA